MSKQVYFVVAVDLETGEVSFDDGTAEARFPDGLMWNETTGEWEEHSDEEYELAYSKVKHIIE